ncbi:hypothetical protein BKA69DRAFT_1121204 [Paraphysoderma sedebokerense]|nr:hypothetical protein BKA69DRAFT_1121204 [Paraphysoderma sedebokerense]
MDQKEPSELSLKVMRLSRPAFVGSLPMSFDKSLGKELHNSMIQHATTTPSISKALAISPQNNESSTLISLDSPTPEISDPAKDLIHEFGLSSLLSLPPSFGNIYLGESFVTALSLNNETNVPIMDMGLKAELQTATQKIILVDTTKVPLPEIEGKNSTEFILHHEVKELGIHILTCSVNYGYQGERKAFKKFYKFQVLNPLQVKTKVHNITSGSVLLEIQVQNVAATPICFERLRLEPSETYRCTDLSLITSAKENVELSVNTQTESVFGNYLFVNPQDILQFLYRLDPKPFYPSTTVMTPAATIPSTPSSSQLPLPPTSLPTGLGKLDLVWRSRFGEFGRLQTSQLVRKVPPTSQDVEVQPISPSLISTETLISYSSVYPITPIPSLDSVPLESPFPLAFRVFNKSNMHMNLQINFSNTNISGVMIVGPAIMNIGEVSKDGHKDIVIEFVGLVPGLQKIGGIKVLDLNTGVVREIETIAEVYVENV